MLHARPVVLGAVLLGGCAVAPGSAVTHATLDAGLQVNLGCIWGFSVGLAGIGVDHADGTSETVTVLLAAGYTGTLLDATLSFTGGELVVPAGGVPRAELFAPYRGPIWGITVGIGVRREQLVNAHGVGLDTTQFAIGITAFTGGGTLYVVPLG